jgi:hypothetical protein
VLHNTSGRFSSSTAEVGGVHRRPIRTPFSEDIVAYGTIGFRSCGTGAATRGLDAQMPSKFGPGCVRRRCLRWRSRSWVMATVTAKSPYQVAGEELAVVEATGTHAVQRGLIGDWTITSFGKIARGPIYRAEAAEVFSGRLGVQRDRSAWAIRCVRSAPAAGSRPRPASWWLRDVAVGAVATPTGTRLAIEGSVGDATPQDSVDEAGRKRR